MNKILILGASGKSSCFLLDYLVEQAKNYTWEITLTDVQIQGLILKYGNNPFVHISSLNIQQEEERRNFIFKADVVISMLPAHMHIPVAMDCLHLKKHLVTASYVSEDMRKLDDEVQKNGLVFMNEIGVDPGLDHMSAMQIIDEIKAQGGEFTRFETFTGGLIAPESDNNPIQYKFTWNPRNVIIAGSSGTVKFLQEGQYKYIPYHKLFRRTEIIEIEGYGKFEAYANRDSLKYIHLYNLQNIKTMYRGTFRRPGFGKLWDVFVQLGATDDSFVIEDSDTLTHRTFINSFLKYHPTDSVELKLMHYLKIDEDSDIMDKLTWLGIFNDEPISLKRATPAQILQHILEPKLKLENQEKDMIVMWHTFDYVLNGKKYNKQTSLVVIGDNHEYTAMAKTVGLPLAMFVKRLMLKEIKHTGVLIPLYKEIYEPILKELQLKGITFIEKNKEIG